jgi:hypothetical protein
MKTIFRNFMLFSSFISLFIFGCDKTPTDPNGGALDSTGSITASELGKAEMENVFLANKNNPLSSTSDFDRVDFSRASTYFKDALAKNPNNADANLGAALCEILTLYADVEIHDAIKQWESFDSSGTGMRSPILRFGIPTGTKDMNLPLSYLGSNLLKIIQSTKTDPPTIAKMQDILKRKLVPRLDYAIARLEMIEKNPTFRFKITGKMQGDANLSPLYLDLTEVYVMDAMLQAMKSVTSMFFIFRFDLASYKTSDIVTAISQNNTTFFVLASDGQQQSQTVKSSLLAGISKIRSGINFLKSETGYQDDHVIRIKTTSSGGIESKDLDTTLAYLTRAEQSLNSTFTVEVRDADTDGNTYMIDVSLSAFFANPPQNPKLNWLPSYTVDTSSTGSIQWHWTAQDYASFTFPDPTLGGLLPGMTTPKLKRLLYIDEEYGYYLECYFNQNQWPSTFVSGTARLKVNGIFYQPKPERNSYPSGWGFQCHFLITDVVGYQGTVYVAINNGAESKVITDIPINVRAKTRENLGVVIDAAPTTITAQVSSAIPRYVSLTLGNWGGFRIERATGTSGAFSQLTLTNGFSYDDKTVASGTTYQYRIMPFYYYGWTGSGQILGGLENNYSNIVTVSVP